MSAETSDAPPRNSARLTGAALEAWYADNPAPAFGRRKPGDSRTAAEKRVPLCWLIAFGGALLLFNVEVPVVAPLILALLGFWLVLGKGYYWLRLGVIVISTFLLGFWNVHYLALLFWLAVGTAVATVLVTEVLHRFGVATARRVRLSIWHLGGAMLLVAIACALTPRLPPPTDVRGVLLFTIAAGVSVLYVGLSVVLACLPVLFPRQSRSGRPFQVSCVCVLLVLPSLGGTVAAVLDGSWEVLTVTYFLHLVGAPVVWGLIFPGEAVGIFPEIEPEVAKQQTDFPNPGTVCRQAVD